MSAKQSRLEIYSLEQFQKADRLDRIRMHMVEPERFVLHDDEWQYARDLEHAWLLVSGETRQGVAIRLIQNAGIGAESWYKANRILKDIEALYAPFLSKNREVQRMRVVEKLYYYADVAEKRAISTNEEGGEVVNQEWLIIAQKFLKEAAEMEGLNAENAPLFDPDELIIPEIEITSDPAAFLAEQIEHEELGPEEGYADEDEA